MRTKSLFTLLGLCALLGAACAPTAPDPGQPGQRYRHCVYEAPAASWRCWDPITVPGSTTSTTRPPSSTTSTTSPSPTSSTTTTVPSTGQAPNGPTGAFRLVWGDEFSGSSLDHSKWRPNWLAGSDSAVTRPINTAELSCYDPGHVTVSGGTLKLRADTSLPTGQACNTRNGPARYASGMVQSDDDYHYTQGYVEARINLPGTCSAGANWPAFWTNGQSWPEDGEIDIMEVLDGSATWHYHWSGGSNGGRGDHLTCESGWHTFGVLREPGRLTFFYDGRNIGSQTTGVVADPHYIILNLGISTEISPPVTVPSQMEVDYVRHFVRA